MDKKDKQEKRALVNITVQRLLQLFSERGIKQSFIEGIIGGYRGKITEWKKGKSSPTEAELRIIAEFLSVPIDYLKGDIDETNLEHRCESDGTKLIARLKGDLPPGEAQEFFKIIDENFDRFMAAKRTSPKQEDNKNVRNQA